MGVSFKNFIFIFINGDYLYTRYKAKINIKNKIKNILSDEELYIFSIWCISLFLIEPLFLQNINVSTKDDIF